MGEQLIPKCKCGGKARYREKGEHCWIECRKCGTKTGYYRTKGADTAAMICEWNRMIKS